MLSKMGGDDKLPNGKGKPIVIKKATSMSISPESLLEQIRKPPRHKPFLPRREAPKVIYRDLRKMLELIQSFGVAITVNLALIVALSWWLPPATKDPNQPLVNHPGQPFGKKHRNGGIQLSFVSKKERTKILRNRQPGKDGAGGLHSRRPQPVFNARVWPALGGQSIFQRRGGIRDRLCSRETGG